MPKPRGWVSVDIRRETRDMLRAVSQMLRLTYDEVIRRALEIIETVSKCRAVFVEGEKMRTAVGTIDASKVVLKCNDYEVSMDPKEYRKLRRILKILPKPEKSRSSL